MSIVLVLIIVITMITLVLITDSNNKHNKAGAARPSTCAPPKAPPDRRITRFHWHLDCARREKETRSGLYICVRMPRSVYFSANQIHQTFGLYRFGQSKFLPRFLARESGARCGTATRKACVFAGPKRSRCHVLYWEHMPTTIVCIVIYIYI